ncbi:hypothetical protein JTB14_038380 [Gonioctena quinquepunctata]|nr:hypothetical protein JTB14_038380 [Gonioctena quinquepunctata]
MAEDTAKNDFVQILCSIKRNFQIVHTKWDSDSKGFEAKFRTQIPPDNEDYNTLCDEWVDLFSEATDTIWAKKISNTGPKIRFRKQYQCWTGDGKTIKKELLFDPTRCKGTIDIKVLSDSLQSRRKNRHMKQGLNIVVKVNFQHLHKVDMSQSLAFFVHRCLPQEEPPKRIIHPNERLPELIAAMVQNGPSVSEKTAARAKQYIGRIEEQNDTSTNQFGMHHEENTLQTDLGQDPLQVGELVPNEVQDTTFQNIESIRFDVLANNDRCPQFVVNSLNTPNQLDVGEQFLMYPLVFDVPQFITLSTQSLAPQFVHILPKADDQN